MPILDTLKATQETTDTYADVVDAAGRAHLCTRMTGGVAFILTTGDATGGCDYQILGTCQDPTVIGADNCAWAIVSKADGNAATGTAAASASTEIYADGHAHMQAYKVQVKYHSGGSAQDVTLTGVTKG